MRILFRYPKVVRSVMLLLLASPTYGQVTFRPSEGKVEILVDGRPFSNLFFGTDWPQPFLHPLRAASGVSLTRGYPVEHVEGESRDHIWHHGLWWAHGDINGVDFWRDKGAATGRIVAIAPPKAKGDTISGKFQLIAPGNQILGSVDQSFRFAARGPLRVVDVGITVRADKAVSLKLGDTEEGALGFRFRDEFREDRGAVLTNASGLTGSKNIWGKRAEWVDYSTQLEGQMMGVTILDHPSNPKHPTYWHARNYGLNAANPFGEHDFLKDKTRDGSVTIPAGEVLAFRYRVVIHPGALDAAQASQWFKEFSKEKQQ